MRPPLSKRLRSSPLSRNFSSHERRLGFWSLAECRVAGRRLVVAVEVLCGHTRGFAPTERGISMRSNCFSKNAGSWVLEYSRPLSSWLPACCFSLIVSTHNILCSFFSIGLHHVFT